MHRYTYAENNPGLYTDPSGHFGQIIAGAAIGAAIGGVGNYGYQVYQNRQNGMDWGQSMSCIKWSSVGGWALAGAGIGALAGIAPVAWPMLQSAFLNTSIAGAGLLTMYPWIGAGLTTLGAVGEGYALYQALFNHNQDAAAGLGIAYSLTGYSAVVDGLGKAWASIAQRQISILGFRGTGFKDPLYVNEPGLIRAGHVGVSMNNGKTIYGFHPSEISTNQFGSEAEVLEFLKNGGSLPGQVFDDTSIFLRASQLASQGAGMNVYEMQQTISAYKYYQIRSSILGQVANPSLTSSLYNFPMRVGGVPQSMPPGCNNCATWPRTLGITIPEETGQLYKYIPMLQGSGSIWNP